jgi:hypothetical protein
LSESLTFAGKDVFNLSAQLLHGAVLPAVKPVAKPVVKPVMRQMWVYRRRLFFMAYHTTIAAAVASA